MVTVPSRTPDEAPAPAPEPGIGGRTAQGFAWLFVRGNGERVITAAGQILLARLLTPKDYTLVALVYTVTTFAGLLQQAGLGQILIQRHDRFRLWAGPVFWMSLAIGVVSAGIVAAAAPLAAAFYRSNALIGLLLVAAITFPVNSLLTVPDARLRSRMRFRFLAGMGLASSLFTVVSSVILAALGFGAYSFIIPQPVVALLKVGPMWWGGGASVGRRPRVRRWRYLVSHSAMLLVALLALMVTYQGGPAILGRMYPALAAAGVYYFAWNLSDQALRLLVNTLAGVLFPALAAIKADPRRQNYAYLRATRALLIMGLPVCLPQALLAGPVIRLVFTARWSDAIPVMAALSLGMTARLITGPAESMFLARGRFRAYMTLCLAYAAVFVPVVAACAAGAGERHSATGAAIGAGLCLVALGALSLRLSIEGGWSGVWRIVWAPLAAGAAAFGPLALVPALLPPTVGGDLLACVLVCALGAPAYVLLIRWWARDDVRDLGARVGALFRRRPPALQPDAAS